MSSIQIVTKYTDEIGLWPKACWYRSRMTKIQPNFIRDSVLAAKLTLLAEFLNHILLMWNYTSINTCASVLKKAVYEIYRDCYAS